MTTEAEVRKEIKFFEDACHELGISLSVLEAASGFRPGIVRQWGWRLDRGQVTKIRDSTLRIMREEVEKRRQAKRTTIQIPKHLVQRESEEADLAVSRVFGNLFDDEEPINIKPQELPVRKLSGCEALTNIIVDRVKGMSLVNLALLLAHIEGGNGK